VTFASRTLGTAAPSVAAPRPADSGV